MTQPVTLITGTSKGIGRYLAEYFVSSGHQVVGCARGESNLDAENYHHVEADVTVENDVKSMLVEVRRRFGRLDNLINNAGVAAMNHSLLTPVGTLERLLKTNVVGTFLLCRESARLMKKSQFGRIVNFSTVAVPLSLEGEAAYVSSKGAVESLTKVLASEFAPFGITVNAVGPGPIETDLIRSVPKDKIEALVARQPLARYGTMEDVSNVCDFFLSKRSGFVSGQTIYLGGIS